MAFTEFYCDAGAGSNLNGGSNAGAPTVAAVTGTLSGTTFTGSASDFDSASVGEWCAVYQLGVDDVAKAVGRITSKGGSGESVTVSAWLGGTPSGSENRCVVGGAWKGPDTSSNFPIGFVAGSFQNAAGNWPRVNFKSGTNYRIMTAATHSTAVPVKYQGYTTTVADGGRAIVQGDATVAGYVLLAESGSGVLSLEDLEFYDNGNADNVGGISDISLCRRVVVRDIRGKGFDDCHCVIECEAYGCNQGNSNLVAGVQLDVWNCWALRTISHDNTGSLSCGFRVLLGGALIDCIADSNGDYGAWTYMDGNKFVNCEFYNNGDSGLFIRNSSGKNDGGYVENCNFVKNGGWAIERQTDDRDCVGIVQSCGFGAGTQANASGDITNMDPWLQADKVTYTADVTPWDGPGAGDFDITDADAQKTGRGAYLQTGSGMSGTVGYPDIGASRWGG